MHFFHTFSFPLLYLPALVQSQYSAVPNSSPTSVSILPAGTSLPGVYNQPLRPQIHFSAPQGFINDPNGCFLDSNGTWHLYYQYNPSQTIAGNQHWGHATSPDLYHWTNQPIAIAPDNSSEGIFSGSAVVDVNNTSGLFSNASTKPESRVVAVYTLNSPNLQTQNLAYSTDGGYHFTKYAGNPVLNIGSANFRDPKVFWWSAENGTGGWWVMIVSYVDEFTVGIFTSPNLKTWSAASNFTRQGLFGSQWECPNLVEVPVKPSAYAAPGDATNGTAGYETLWLMYVSLQPGAPQGGSIAQYFPGVFNGTHFQALDNGARIADWGKDNYAGQFFDQVDIGQYGGAVSIAWASNWQYTNLVPTGPKEGWQSVMTLPRVNYLTMVQRLGWQLVSEPYGGGGVAGLKGGVVEMNGNLGNGSLSADLRGGSGAFVIEVVGKGVNMSLVSAQASVNYTIMSSVSGESIFGGSFIATDMQSFMDRGNVRGFENVFFTNRFSTSQVVQDGFDFKVFVDRSIVEVFLLGASQSSTSVFYPEFMLDQVLVSSAGLNAGAQLSVAVYDLASAWASEEDANGVVYPSNGTIIRRQVNDWWPK